MHVFSRPLSVLWWRGLRMLAWNRTNLTKENPHRSLSPSGVSNGAVSVKTKMNEADVVHWPRLP